MRKCYELLAVFMLIACFAGCNKDDGNNPPSNDQSNNNEDSSPEQYFEATIDGEKHRINLGEDAYQSYLNYTRNMHSHDHDSSSAVYGISLTSHEKNKEPTIRLGEFHWDPRNSDSRNPSKSRFHAFFQEKSYGYQYREVIDGGPSSRTHYNGAMILWTDQNGKTWRTQNDTTDSQAQEGSSFQIIEIIEKGEKEFSEKPMVTCEMEFNCKLYDENGNSISLKDGKARMTFVTN